MKNQKSEEKMKEENPPVGPVDYYREDMRRTEDKALNVPTPNIREQEDVYPDDETISFEAETEEAQEEAQDISLDEEIEEEEAADSDALANSSSNEGGIYPEQEAFDQDSPAYEAGTPGHPGIDDGTA